MTEQSTSHNRQIDVIWKLSADQLDALRPHAHAEVLDGLAVNGGVQPNEFADNDLQAADYAAQADPMVVSLALVRALKLGLSQMLPQGEINDIAFRPLPEDYTPPSS